MAPRRALLIAATFVVAACQSGGSNVVTLPPTVATASALPLATSGPTAAPTKPVAVPRPTDLRTDGTCDHDDQSCLGVLEGGTVYRSGVFEPTITFAVSTSDWVNLGDTGGEFGLLSISMPGDAIFFLREPHAIDPKIGRTVPDLVAWLASYDQVKVTPAQPVMIGGLEGVTLDVRSAPGATATDPGCPVQVCVPIFRGDDTVVGNPYPWHWQWGTAGPETQRMYLLNWEQRVIAIFVDSLDGTTFDAITKAFDQIEPSIKFG